MKSAIVILNWNGSDMMRKYLPTVITNSTSDVIVADNASTDNSMQMLSTEFPTIRTIAFDQNYGFAEGYNRALWQLKDEYEYLVLLNSDVETRQKDWDKILVDYMVLHPECGACQPKLLDLRRLEEMENANGTSENNDIFFEYAGASGGYIDRFGYPFCRGRVMSTVEKDTHQYDDVAELLWATGAALMVRTADFFNVGGLDSRFFAHMEEIDLCWRLRTMGRTVVCIPQSTAYHLGGASLNYGNPRKTFLNFRNNLLMLYKNLPDGELTSILFVRFILDMVAALQMLLTGQFTHAWAVIKAEYTFYKIRKKWKDERKCIQKSRTVPRVPERRTFSLLLEYYLKGHKTYNQLPH